MNIILIALAIAIVIGLLSKLMWLVKLTVLIAIALFLLNILGIIKI